MSPWFALFFLVPLVYTIPLEPRAVSLCDQYDSINSGPYTLFTDMWGETDAASGSQCSSIKSYRDDAVAWTTNYHWIGGDSVKTFSNIQLNDGINQPLSAIHSMKSAWDWSMKIEGSIVADVAYDFFTSDTAGGPKKNEIMVWLANYNSKAISFEYDYGGNALPIATGLDIAGRKWDLYYGSNGYNTVYSFLPTEGPITHFSGDMYGFFTNLMNSGYISPSQYLIIAQAGTEVTSGAGTLTTAAYSLTIA